MAWATDPGVMTITTNDENNKNFTSTLNTLVDSDLSSAEEISEASAKRGVHMHNKSTARTS